MSAENNRYTIPKPSGRELLTILGILGFFMLITNPDPKGYTEYVLREHSALIRKSLCDNHPNLSEMSENSCNLQVEANPSYLSNWIDKYATKQNYIILSTYNIRNIPEVKSFGYYAIYVGARLTMVGVFGNFFPLYIFLCLIPITVLSVVLVFAIWKIFDGKNKSK